jgi:hypothetical protein
VLVKKERVCASCATTEDRKSLSSVLTEVRTLASDEFMSGMSRSRAFDSTVLISR